MTRPPVRYATTSDGLEIAYQVLGEGPLDVVIVPGLISSLDRNVDYPFYGCYLRRFPRFARTIVLDKRGGGVSDREVGTGSPENRLDDVRAVMDAVGSERAALLGQVDGAAIALLFAATYPERTEALVLGDTFARMRHAADYPDGLGGAAAEAKAKELYGYWGYEDRRPVRRGFDDPSFAAWRARFERLSLSPGALETMYPVCDLDVDVRSVLGSIRTPTLVFHRRDNAWIPFAFGRYLAEHIHE